MTVVYVDHGQRPESKGEAEAVRILAGLLQLRFHVRIADCPPGSSEEILRDARYRELNTCAGGSSRGGIFLGHHAQDVLELFLMRLMGGAGVHGLSGMRPVQEFSSSATRLRPLLRVNADDIRSILTANGIQWCEDGSNRNSRYVRNRVRQKIVPPVLEVFGKERLSQFLQTHRQLRELSDWVCQTAEAAWTLQLEKGRAGLQFRGRPWQQGWMSIQEIGGLPELLQREILRLFLNFFSKDLHGFRSRIEQPLMDSLIVAIARKEPAGGSVTHGVEWSLQKGRLVVQRVPNSPEWPACPWHWKSGPVFVPNAGSLELGKVSEIQFNEIQSALRDGTFPKLRSRSEFGGGQMEFLDAGQIAGKVLVDRWRPGDRFRPPGAGGSKKLKDCFVDRKIPHFLRQWLPVLRSEEGGILWIAELGMDESVKLGPQSKAALHLTYRRPSSD